MKHFVDMPPLTKLERIDATIQRTSDRRLLRLLNKAWWKEWLRKRAKEPCTNQ